MIFRRKRSKRNLLFVLALCLSCLFSMAAASAAGKQDVRIAVLPLRLAENLELAPGAYEELDAAFRRSVDEAVKKQRSLIAYVPQDESREVYEAIVNRVEGNDDPMVVLEPLAYVLEADIVLQPELIIYQQKDYLTLNQSRTESKMYTASVAGICLIGYDAAEQKLFTKTETRLYDYEQANVGQASYLARKCMDQALKDTKIKERVAEAAQHIQH